MITYLENPWRLLGSPVATFYVNVHISEFCLGVLPTLMIYRINWDIRATSRFRSVTLFLISVGKYLGTAVTAMRPITSYCIPVMSNEEGFL